jgi:hypothetical protein
MNQKGNLMATEAQAAANAANAQFSTGPRTIPGRAQSALNSLRHGLTAKTVLLPNEDPAEYQAFAVAMQADLGPDNVIEFSLAQELISLQGRLQRVPALEARILSADVPDFKALNNISLHAARMTRQYAAMLKEFLLLKGGRIRSRENAMESAATLRRADIILKRPTDLAQFGFVFTLDDVDAWIRDTDALASAHQTIRDNDSRQRGRLM